MQKIEVPYNVQGKLIHYLERHFRTIADKDYISARSNFCMDLPIQFLWAAEQAIEKYLKAIILFCHYSVKDISHELCKAYERAEMALWFSLDLSEEEISFLNYLNQVSNNRYLQSGYCVVPEQLHLLDKIVWSIRRFCQPLRLTEGSDPELSESDYTLKIERLTKKDFKNSPGDIKVPRGYLEELIFKEHGNQTQREALLHNNKVYHSHLKTNDSSWSPSILAGNVEIDKDLLAVLKKLIKIN